MPGQGQRPVYTAGDWEIDLTRRELRAGGEVVPLGLRAFEILELLVKAAGRLVIKNELMARVWRGMVVEENTLHVHMSALRKAFRSDRGMLKTVAGHGYRLAGDWAIRNSATTSDQVAFGQTLRPERPFQAHFPIATPNLIGRAAAVRQLRDLVSAYRTVTLTGPGGIGKTALALELARDLIPNLAGDAWLVELAALSDPDLVPATVAGVLGLSLGGREISPEAVAQAINGDRLLIVLDNCEHVIDAAANLVETIVRRCPATSVIATSREALRSDGERVYRVPPLDVPGEYLDQPDLVRLSSAVQLLIARATEFDPGFSSDGDRISTIAAICRRLDGIPLAIEFAAARVTTMGIQ
jgi:non-specific serine/threonine protein kinase